MQPLQGRPSLRRGAPSPTLLTDHAAGEYTPQVSPLDDLINRGRMLQKQMGSERAGSAGLSPLTVHRSLRRAGSNPGTLGTLGTLARSRSVGKTPEVERGGWWGNAALPAPGAAATTPTLGVMGDRQLATPALEDRPTSSHPRFSMISDAASDDGKSDRDSIMSGATSVRDSNFTLISGFLNPVRNPPNLQQIQGRHEVKEQDVERSSLKPVIVGHIKDERQRREADRMGPGPGSVGARGGLHVDNQPTGATAQRRAPEDRQLGPPRPEGRQRNPEERQRNPEERQRNPEERQRRPPGPPGPGGRQRGPDGRQHSPGQRQRGPDGRQRGPDERQRGRGQDQRDMAGQDNASAYARSRSQPPPRNRRPPGRQPLEAEQQFPMRKDSKDLTVVIPPGPSGPPTQLVQPSQSARAYIPYRQDSKSSPLGYSAPSRQGSAESGKFPPPIRQASGERLYPHRNDSRGSDRRFYPRSPRREDSNDSVTKYLPYRQGSGDAEFQRPSRTDSLESVHRSYSPQLAPRTASPAQATLSIFPMISDFRASSPDSIGAESSLTFGPPSAPLTRDPLIPYGGTDGHEMTRSASQSSFRSDAPSVYSVGGTLLQKPAFNFSRPLSSRPSLDSEQPSPFLDIPQRLSPEQSPMFPGEQSLPTPVSISGDPTEDTKGPVPTYIYSKFALPRGREPERNSVIFQDAGGYPGQSVYQQTHSPRTAASSTTTVDRPPSPSSPPRTFLQPAPPPRDPRRSPQTGPTPSLSPHIGFLTPTVETRGRSAGATSPCSPRTPDSRSNSSQPPSATMLPDEHVQLGIDLHESGSLQESTYHLRLAANAGHPTGMLLFALACRHGWGMKANQKEGVMWLKKVTELASSEVADDEQAGGSVDYIEKKGRRAQFALSIYELGVSHMNGWGTEKDQGLALRCFEIAGSMFTLLRPSYSTIS